jgi:hypothetical protein
MRLFSLRAGAGAALVVLAALPACRSRPPASTPSPKPAPAPIRTTYDDGDDVIAAMRARYDGKWYRTLTFTQKTSRLLADGTWRVDAWYEAMKLPGQLRIDFDPISAGNGVLYAKDSAFTIRNGRPLPGQRSINPLLLLGFDIYFNSAERTAALLRREGYDLTRVHADVFQGRPMIVVGVRQKSDSLHKQFWIDAERLYFVRTLGPAPTDLTKVQDVRFVNYQRRGDAWIAPRVEIHTGGKLVFFEDYSDIHTNLSLDDALFDPGKWKTARHWLTP